MREQYLKNQIRKTLEKLGIEDVITLNDIVRLCTKYANDTIKRELHYKLGDKEIRIKHLGKFTEQEADVICEVLRVDNRYFKSWDLESYSSGIEEIDKDDFKELFKAKTK